MANIKESTIDPLHIETDSLSDFTTDSRVLLLSAMALVIGAISAVVAYALVWLIAVITNLSFFHTFSSAPATPQEAHLGAVGDYRRRWLAR